MNTAQTLRIELTKQEELNRAMLEALEVALHSGELSLGNAAYAMVAEAIRLARGL